MTATVYAFPECPEHTRGPRLVSSEPASIIIMPVVRIDRHPDDLKPRRRRPRRNLREVTSSELCGND